MILSSVFLFAISAHFGQFIVFYKTAPRRLKAAMNLRSVPNTRRLRVLFRRGDRTSSFHFQKWMRPFQMLCGTPAFSLWDHYSIFYLIFFPRYWFECSLKQGGSPRKVIYLFSPYFLLCIVCQTLPVSLGFLSQGRFLWCMSLCVSSSLPRAAVYRSCSFLVSSRTQIVLRCF